MSTGQPPSPAPPQPGPRSTPRRDWLATQALMLGVAAILAVLYPVVHGVIIYGFLGLVIQLLPPGMVFQIPPGGVTAPADPAEKKPDPETDGSQDEKAGVKNYRELVVPWTMPVVINFATHTFVIYLLLLNPLVYVLKHFFLPFSLAVGDDKAVIRRLRLRAMVLRWAAATSLLMIVGLLLIGLLIFISADRLGSPEGNAQPAPAEAAKEKGKKEKAKEEKAETQAIKSPDMAAVAFVVASSVATRIAAAFMLVFLVKILAELYRYNVRLAAFSDSRADALEAMPELATKSPANLKKIAVILAADKVPFTEAATPVAEIAAALAPVAKKVSEIGEKLGDKSAEKKPTSTETK